MAYWKQEIQITLAKQGFSFIGCISNSTTKRSHWIQFDQTKMPSPFCSGDLVFCLLPTVNTAITVTLDRFAHSVFQSEKCIFCVHFTSDLYEIPQADKIKCTHIQHRCMAPNFLVSMHLSQNNKFNHVPQEFFFLQSELAPAVKQRTSKKNIRLPFCFF